ncbi:hypothetical protein [Pelagibaculum spongiae]|uniref:hypothetical protein n=1 Tax=Pelagibaculum spongiae TaxID=2080658 RepID=UPI002106E837|nr:hypothetical protein [Pelagibaculum spongiae]
MRDLIVATGASTASSTNRDRFAGYDYSATPDFESLKNCWQAADHLGLQVRYGNIFSNDLFYGGKPKKLAAMKKWTF